MKYNFTKMHGLGNDFVIIDLRDPENKVGGNIILAPSLISKLSKRKFGIGCDQMIILREPDIKDKQAHKVLANMEIYNPDGSAAEACGNANRCVTLLLSKQNPDLPEIAFKTPAGIVTGHVTISDIAGSNEVTVTMGKAKTHWSEIPLSIPLNEDELASKFKNPPAKPMAVSVGNPHLVIFVEDLDVIDVESLGRNLTHHPSFPQQTNVEFVQVIDNSCIKVRIYERGTGITLACGTGASASAVAAFKRGLAEQKQIVKMDGGNLIISLDRELNITMTGGANITYKGYFDTDDYLAK